jgi:hypothetical protein
MKPNHKKIVRTSQTHSCAEYWVEYPEYCVELSINPADRITKSCGMDWISVNVWDCAQSGSGEFLFSEMILAVEWDTNGADTLDDIAYFTALNRQITGN